MGPNDLTVEQIQEFENQLMQHVPDVGTIGNGNLRTTLTTVNDAWTVNIYWFIRNRLVEQGKILRGRGYGGSVRRPPVAQAGADAEARPGAAQPQAEQHLYDPMLSVIKENWPRDYEFDAVIVVNTAHGGARPDGRWSRPDLTLAGYKTYPYVPGRHFELITFEIKTWEGVDVTVVYEALAHRRAATRAYALLYVPGDRRADLASEIEEICSEARRVGVGVIVAETQDNYDTWDELVEALRHDPDPQRMNDFLTAQTNAAFKETIVRWFR